MFSQSNLNNTFFPVLKNDKWGYIDVHGNLKHDMHFNYASQFYGEYAIVESDSLLYFIDTTFSRISSIKFNGITHLNNDIAILSHDKQMFIYNITTENRTNLYDTIEVFGKGFYKAIQDSLCHLYNQNLKLVLTLAYEDMFMFHDSLIITIANEKVGLSSISGKQILQPEYDEIRKVNNDILKVRKNGRWGYFSLSKNTLSKFLYRDIDYIKQGLFKALTDSGYHLLKYPSWDMVFDDEYDDLYEINKDNIIFRDGKKIGLISMTQDTLIHAQYDELTFLLSNHYKVKSKGKYGVLNINQDTIVPIIYSDVDLFDHDIIGTYHLKKDILFKVKSPEGKGLIDGDGRIIIPANYYDIKSKTKNLFITIKKRKMGLYNRQGKEVAPPQYHAFSRELDSVIIGRIGDYYGLINNDTVFVQADNNQIVINNNVAVLYKDSLIDILHLENGFIQNQTTFKGFPKYTINNFKFIAENEVKRFLSKSIPTTGFEMFFSQKHGLWGVKDKNSPAVVIPPRFKKKYTSIYNQFRIVEIHSDSVQFRIDDIDFVTNSLYGIVDLENGEMYKEPEYVFHDLPETHYNALEHNTGLALEVNNKGEFRFVAEDVIKKSYIDKYSRNSIRYNEEGNLTVSDKNKNSVAKFPDFFNRINRFSNLSTTNMYSLKKSYDHNQYLNIEDGQWYYKYINRINKNQVIKSKEYNYVSEAYDTIRIVSNGQFGTIDPKGEYIISPVYDSIELDNSFGNYVFYVTEDISYCGAIDTSGSQKIDFEYQAYIMSENGFIAFRMDSAWMFYNENLQLQFKVYYDDISPYNEHLCRVQKNGKYGFINEQGKEIVPCIYDMATYFNNGYSLVTLNGLYGYIRKDGSYLIDPKYKIAEEFRHGYAKAKLNKDRIIIDTTGTEILNYGRMKVGEANKHKKLWIKERKGKYYIFDLITKKKTSKNYHKIIENKNGFYVVKKRDKYGYVNLDGYEVIKPIYKKAKSFNNGLASVKKEKRWNYIDTLGNDAIQMNYNKSSDFKYGCAIVQRRDSVFCVDKDGDILFLFPDYVQEIQEIFPTYFIAFTVNNKYAFLDRKGEMLFGKEFDNIDPFNAFNLSVVKDNDKHILINKEGEELYTTSQYALEASYGNYALLFNNKYKGILDYNGDVILPSNYDNIKQVSKDIFLLERNGSIGYYNLNEKHFFWEFKK